MSEPYMVKNAVADHFETFFNMEDKFHLVDLNCDLHRLSKESSQNLEKPFAVLKIFEAVKSNGSGTAHGLDGFNLDFFKRHWICSKKMSCIYSKNFIKLVLLTSGLTLRSYHIFQRAITRKLLGTTGPSV